MVSLSVFNYHAKDLVTFVFDADQHGNVANNIGEQQGHGGEFWLKWKQQNNRIIDMSYTYLSAKNQLNENIAKIPNSMAFIGINWQVSNDWLWNIDAKWLDQRFWATGDARKPLNGYTLINSKLTRKNMIKGVDVALIIKNLLDNDAREPSNTSIPDDYPLAGRQLLLETSYNF